MASKYTNITANEFEQFITALGFSLVGVPGAAELVYGKIIGQRLCLRVFSGIVGSNSRGCGEDAIRCAIVYKDNDGNILPVGKQKRVNRTQGWKKNLKNRIDEAISRTHEICSCGKPMVIRANAKTGDKFYGCIGYPQCKNTKPCKATENNQ